MNRARLNFRGALLLIGCALSTAFAQTSPTTAVVFENVRVFDGKGARLSAPTNVLVVGNLIQEISATSVAATVGDIAVQRIQGNGRTLMPGLIDNHWHTMLVGMTPEALLNGDIGFANLVAAAQAEAALMRGFTTVRDLGGPSFGLKRAIDMGIARGPRIYPSGAMITITGGHGDFRSPPELPRRAGELSRMEILGGSMLADSPDEVRLRVREQLLLGASQVKLTAGGGVASPHSPLDVSTFTEEELRAAVQAAENWGTYICVHAYTPAAIQRAINAGVKVIEHGHLMDDATAQLMAKRGIWLSFQAFLDDEAASPVAPTSRARQLQVFAGTESTIALAKKHKLRMAWGTDLLFSAENAPRQIDELTKMRKWFSPAEVLTMATSTNAELLKLSGPRDPYPGKLGVVEAGALADLLLVDGDPLANLELLADPAKLLVIMKDGKIYKGP